MTPFWVTLESRVEHKPGQWTDGVCVEAETPSDAKKIAEEETGVKAVECKKLPYPAFPRLGKQSDCPAFCHSPRECQGRRSCPKGYACSE